MVHRLDRQAEWRHHQGKAHDSAGERSPCPAEGKDDAEFGEKGADRGLAAERQQQQVAGHHRRHDERQMYERVEEALAPEAAARSSQAMATPNGRLATVAVDSDQQLSRTAVHSSGCHCSKMRPSPVREALLLEGKSRLGAFQAIEEEPRVGRL